jgi:hypothetical protein
MQRKQASAENAWGKRSRTYDHSVSKKLVIACRSSGRLLLSVRKFSEHGFGDGGRRPRDQLENARQERAELIGAAPRRHRLKRIPGDFIGTEIRQILSLKQPMV